MAKKELRKLNRAELLELLVAQTERADRLTEELREAKAQIQNREDLIRQAGELAVAAARLIKLLETEKLRAAYVQPQKAAPKPQPPVRQAKPQAVKPAPKPQPQKKEKGHETNGIDLSAIVAITSGIGKGKI